ncbi:MAG: hypothetical protein HRT44_06740 [Bdellovibrionales bacterium]|nr:hypothetical protein [Bdellovibrionales bacterium]NQZ18935.1 hypothetical protein [Bdellovibrionales bacterium]
MFRTRYAFCVLMSILLPALASAQTLIETAVDGNINVFHSNFISGGFTNGLMNGEQHPRELVTQYDEFRSSIEAGRADTSEVMRTMGASIDQIITACGGTNMYSTCTTLNCRRSARRQLNSCGLGDQLSAMNEEVAKVENLHAQLHSDQTEFALAQQEMAPTLRALGVEMRVNTVIVGQSLMGASCAPVDLEDEKSAEEERRLQVACMKRAWGMIHTRMGCEEGTAVAAEYASMVSTQNFQSTICGVALRGMENGFINSDDFIHTFEPNANWDQYTETAE